MAERPNSSETENCQTNDVIRFSWKELISKFSVLEFAARESGLPKKAFFVLRLWNLKIVNDRDRDWPIKTVGITGLKKNFDRDGGIEEPYWGPSSVLGEDVDECRFLSVLAIITQKRIEIPRENLPSGPL